MKNKVIYNKNFGYFKVYSSTSVESTDIIRISRNYYGKEWFSDVIVSSEDSDWYEKVLISFLIFIIIKFMFSSYITLLTEFNFLLLEFFTEDKKDPINLILLRWYDE